MEYQQDSSNICCLNLLVSELHDYCEVVADRDIAGRIGAPLVCKSKGYHDEIQFDNTIMIDKEQNKRDQCLYYNIKQ